MRALQRFEDWVNGLLEGGLVSLLGARIQPVDIARRLADHMEDHRTVGAGRLYVPNNYRVFLAPATLAGFASLKTGLEAELASFLAARAQEGGYHFVGRVRVLLLADPDLKPERLRIEADLVDRRGVVLGEGGQRTEAIPIGAVPPPSGPPELVLVIGERRVATRGRRRLTLGRALDNTVILDEVSVSRHHARLELRTDHWALEDLGSTHGTFVNGTRLSAGPLRPGDRLQLGRAVIQLEAEGGADAGDGGGVGNAGDAGDAGDAGAPADRSG